MQRELGKEKAKKSPPETEEVWDRQHCAQAKLPLQLGEIVEQFIPPGCFQTQ